jgi:uncharacterized membrane protein YkoI
MAMRLKQLFLLAASLLVLGGLTTIAWGNRKVANTALSAAPRPVNPVADYPDDDSGRTYELDQIASVTLVQAVQTAEAFVGELATEANLEWTNNTFVYSVEIGNQDIIINANTGEIMFTDIEDEDEPDLRSLTTITLQQAIQMAETAANNRAYSAELERENSTLVYVVEIGDQAFHIDPTSGDILHIEVKSQAVHKSTIEVKEYSNDESSPVITDPSSDLCKASIDAQHYASDGNPGGVLAKIYAPPAKHGTGTDIATGFHQNDRPIP